jgi:hypothetical protein
VPRDQIEFRSGDPLLPAMADRLWSPGGDAGRPIRITISLRPGPFTPRDSEPGQAWSLERDRAELRSGDALAVTMDVPAGEITGWVAEGFTAAHPEAARRLLLEIPVAVLLQRRGYSVLHAGAVAGPAGAVVIRGAAGAGKSTLVAAAHLAGLDVLGDESILVARDDPDQILAAVREITLEPDAVRLLGVEAQATPIARDKARMTLAPWNEPGLRARRRRATVLLGPRTGTARLEPMDQASFRREFAAGTIREEHWGDAPTAVAEAWSDGEVYRLSGAADLPAAVELLAALVGLEAPVLSIPIRL